MAPGCFASIVHKIKMALHRDPNTHATTDQTKGQTNGSISSSSGPDDSPRGVHLIGSVPHESLASVEQVWSKMLTSLPGRLCRVPDGELGSRFYYVNWQASVFPQSVLRATNMVGDQPSGQFDASYVPKLEDIKPTGYDDVAIESYQHFVKQRESGAIAKGIRFQVCLPSPLEAVGIHVHAPYQAAVAPLYEQRMLEALANIQAAIPAEDLAIQWDVAVTFGFIEYERGNLKVPFFKPWFPNALEHSLEVLKRVSFATNKDVEMGYHLCYGDVEHQHFVEPKDTSLIVEVANRMVKDVHPAHSIAYFHLPVPKDRTDAAYFRPLNDLHLPTATQLFLGVVHFDDLKGTQDRIAAAQQFAPKNFGVATECGMGRTPKEQLDGILDVARAVSGPYKSIRSKI